MLRRLPLQFEHLQHVISDAVQLGEWLQLFKQPNEMGAEPRRALLDLPRAG
jgi:hypothetical protein